MGTDEPTEIERLAARMLVEREVRRAELRRLAREWDVRIRTRIYRD